MSSHRKRSRMTIGCTVLVLSWVVIAWLLPFFLGYSLDKAWEAAEKLAPIIAELEQYKTEEGHYPDSIDWMSTRTPEAFPKKADGLTWSYDRLGDDFCLTVDTEIDGESGKVHLLYWSKRRDWAVGE